jgi:hypothetical protein
MASNSDNLISAKALQEIENPSLFRKSMAIKSLFVAISISTLLASNIASLTSSAAHNWMHSVLWTFLSIGGDLFADKALSNSPKSIIEQKVKAQTTDLEVKNKKLVQQIEANGILAKETVATVNKRIAKGIARNIAALPSEAVPFVGIAVMVASTTLDVYDACQTMKDFNVLLNMLGQGEENPELCGKRVPTVDEVKASAKTLLNKKQVE